MDIKELAQGKYVLWGANWSLYTAKVRPYLIKKGIDYIELNPSHPHFHDSIVPRIGHITVPVVEAPDGAFVADSTEIILHLEQRYPDRPMIPDNRVMAALAWLVHNFGSEGLLKPAMHYRWNTLEENRPFIVDEFSRSLQIKEMRGQAEKTAGLIYAEHIWDYLPLLGVADKNTAIIEKSTGQLYEILNAHFLEYPYLLGGSPSIADFGLMAPVYAHLGRDPSSNSQLKLEAPALYRWIETMGRAPVVDPELWYVPPGFFSPDELPDTLTALLAFIASDYGPEMLATAAAYHEWLPGKSSGDIVAHDGVKANHQVLAEVEHVQQGGIVKHAAFLDVLTLHQHVTSIVRQMSDTEMAQYEGILRSAGAGDIFELALQRPIVRDDYAYVLA
jgi:glutathione S-transferase